MADTDVRCPVCGERTAYAADFVDQPGGGRRGIGHPFPSRFACRNGCDQRDMEAWRTQVDQVRAEWLTFNPT
jgi:hypothetical protein